MLKLSGITLIAAISYVLLKRERTDFAFVLEICSTAGIVIFILPYMENLISIFTQFTDSLKLDFDFTGILIKTSGIAIIARLVSELCRDAGENALAVKFELASKVLILVNAIPAFKALYGMLTAIVEKLL